MEPLVGLWRRFAGRRSPSVTLVCKELPPDLLHPASASDCRRHNSSSGLWQLVTYHENGKPDSDSADAEELLLLAHLRQLCRQSSILDGLLRGVRREVID